MSVAVPEPAPSVLVAACASRQVLNHITSRWGLLILIAVRDETLRFSVLRRRIDGVSERMLAQSLQRLERDGFVARKAFDIVPPHVEYSLTALGREVTVHASALASWIENNLHRLPHDAIR